MHYPVLLFAAIIQTTKTTMCFTQSLPQGANRLILDVLQCVRTKTTVEEEKRVTTTRYGKIDFLQVYPEECNALILF